MGQRPHNGAARKAVLMTGDRRTDEGGTTVIRRVAAEAVLLAGGGRAILLQVAHPAVAHGVHDHSDFATRPLDRLHSTMRYVYGVLFGSPAQARSISRAVSAVHRRVTGPGYSAADPALQVWVNATLYDTATLLHQRVHGPLSPADLDACYQQYSVLATSIGCPREHWPADRAAFARYWAESVRALVVGDTARGIAAGLFRPAGLPLALRPAMPLHRFVTTGLLPEPVRAGYGLPWSPRQEALLDRALDLTAAIYPRLPRRLRHAPKELYLRDLRRRLARHRG